MNRLRRSFAPISDAAWHQIDDEATQALENFLAGRRLVDFVGPLGWETSSVSTGRTEAEPGFEGNGVVVRRRTSLDLYELRTPFSVARAELDAIDRGARDADLSPVLEAAKRAALAEDTAIFHGIPGAGFTGLAEGSPHKALTISEDVQAYPTVVAQAVADLQDAGVTGPYALAVGTRCYQNIIETSERGGPLLKHLRLILEGPLVWARAVDGAVVLSQRGDDAELVVGGDFAIGYERHDDDHVDLYLEESLTLRILAPEFALPLTHA